MIGVLLGNISSSQTSSFVDRDMLMRYLGGGVGHKAFRRILDIKKTLAILKARLVGGAGHATEMEAEQGAL